MEDKLVQRLLKKDPTLLTDLLEHKDHDIHKLLHRLNAVVKAIPGHVQNDCSKEEEENLLEKLVQCYVITSDSMRLSRAVEKIWQPYADKHADFLKSCLEKHVMAILQKDDIEVQQIGKLSGLFEQNKIIQELFRRNLPGVASWISEQFSRLKQPDPGILSLSQEKCLHTIVKICLQLVKVCPQEIGAEIWTSKEASEPSDLYQSLRVIIDSLIHLVSSQGYPADCVLLCGTALALVINTAGDQQMACLALVWILAQSLCLNAVSSSEVFSEIQRGTTCLQVDKMQSKLSDLGVTRLGPVAIIRGTVTCGQQDWLLAFHHRDSQAPTQLQYDQTFLQFLLDLIFTLCQGDITLRYHSFQVLNLWYTRLCKISPTEKSCGFYSNPKTVIEVTLDLIMKNWDSPVEDVSETVVEIFTQMMSLWNQVKTYSPDLPDRVLSVLLRAHWYVKGKYRIMAALLKYIDSEKILQGSDEVQTQLLQCLTTNHLASSSTTVYRAFLQTMHGDEDVQAEAWKKSWLPTVVQGLTSNNSLLHYNVSLHWVPVTLRTLPVSGACLHGHLTSMLNQQGALLCRIRSLHAWIVVAKTIRNLTGTVDLSDPLVRECLYCEDEDVRSEAIGLVCNTLKKAECITELEVSLLKETLVYNIKIDSAPFRQHLCANLRRMMVRLRDSCITMLKSPEVNKNKLDYAIEFVDWLHGLCIESLLPGACYQRRKGSLDLLHVLYETLVYRPNSRHRKGFTPEAAVSLTRYAEEMGRWMFHREANIFGLLLCILDSADEIQSSACQLLLQYWPQAHNVGTPDYLCEHLLTEALRLCNSPKGHEGQSGAVLGKLIFQRFVVDGGTCLTFEADSEGTNYSVRVKPSDGDEAALQFLSCLLTEVQRCLTLADRDLVKASKHFPIHGLMSALCACVTDSGAIWQTQELAMQQLISKIIHQCQGIIEKMLSIMARVAEQEACPSFAEIGMALEGLLQENQSGYVETAAQSAEFQYLLSWCWNNIKESCHALGELMWTVVTQRASLPTELVHSMRATFLTVLTKCRHKGVIEGCRSAFVRFCSALFNSSDSQLHATPADILNQVLMSLKNKQMTSSVTRRSAGLPIIILALLVSEKNVKKTVLLVSAIESLFEVCSLPLEEDAGLMDLPQVHGLNVLNSLYSDASLTSSLLGHVSWAVVLVIRQFGSPSWAVRNAATRLFSTLVTRIFGQKKSSDGELCNSVTLQEFSSYYPELPPFLQQVLSEASKTNIQDISNLHPGLFPVLTLLSCLKPMDASDAGVNSTQSQYLDKILIFAVSPVYQLRQLVAPAVVAMVNMVDMATFCESLVTGLLEKQTSLNSLHGQLMIVNKLLDNIIGSEDLEKLWALLADQVEVILSSSVCLVASEYLAILNKLLPQIKHPVMEESLVNLLLDSCCCPPQQGSVGRGVYMKQAVGVLLTLGRQGQCDLAEVGSRLLTLGDTDMRRALLEALLTEDNCILTLNSLFKHIMKEDCVQNQSMLLELTTRLYLKLKPSHVEGVDFLLDWLQQNSSLIHQYVSLDAKSLPVQAICIKHSLQGPEKSDCHLMLQEWCLKVHSNSLATNETQRLSAALAILVAGQQVLDYIFIKKDTKLGKSLSRFSSACLTFIQDENTEVRAEACRFVSQLQWGGKKVQFSSTHSSVCYELFLDLLSGYMTWCGDVVSMVASQIYRPGELTSVLKDRESSRFEQLFDQEDNSFFAERIYNAFSLHSCLKKWIMGYLDAGNTSPQDFLVGLAQSLEADLGVLRKEFACLVAGSVIHKFCDNSILAVICGLLLLSNCVAMVMKKSDGSKLKQNLMDVQQNHIHILPPSLQRMIKSAVDWHTQTMS